VGGETPVQVHFCCACRMRNLSTQSVLPTRSCRSSAQMSYPWLQQCAMKLLLPGVPAMRLSMDNLAVGRNICNQAS